MFRVLRIAGGAVAAFVVGLLLLVLVQTGQDVRRQIDALATANSDNTQWSLAQADVEILTLQTAATAVLAGDGAVTLNDIRERFDIFYSRVQILSESPLYAPLRADADVDAALARIDLFLTEMVPLIDAPDAVLAGALDQLVQRTGAIRYDVRVITLRGVAILAGDADRQRSGVADTLTLVSALTVTLFVVLILLLALLVHFVRLERDRARAEAHTKARLAAIVATSLDAVIVADQHGRLIEFNGAAETIFGHARDAVIGRRMEDLIIPDHMRDAHRRGMARYQRTGERRVIGKGRVRLEALRASGEVFPIELSISQAETRDGEIFVAYARDITQRVAEERELIEARDRAVAGERAKADLIAVMSHEMRTPLNGMLGTLDLLQHDPRTPRDAEYLEIIRNSGRQLLHHVDTVLEVSRAEAGKIVPETEVFSLSALTRELVEGLRGVAEHRGNALVQRVAPDGPDRVLGDPTRIRQVLTNLVGNAIKFTRNGTVDIEVARTGTGDMVSFTVRDDGIGIDPADQDRIFEDFVTLDTSYARAAGGTGLGLAIVRRLVTAMGGEIGVDSAKGQGSTFHVRLPLPAAPDDMPLPGSDDSDAPAAPVAPMKVLIVEDNRINRLVLRELLERDGHSVAEAHDGREGVAMASRNSYDIVLMDISMPVLDGVAATREIRAAEARGTRLPIVALTAHAGEADREGFKVAGLDDILVKPITRDALRRILARSSGRPQVPATPEPVARLDIAQLDDLAETLGRDRLDALLDDFLDETEAAVADIAARLDAPPHDSDLADRIHHAAGSSALIGATDLRTELATLETALRGGHPVAEGSAARLRAVWAATTAAIARHRAGQARL